MGRKKKSKGIGQKPYPGAKFETTELRKDYWKAEATHPERLVVYAPTELQVIQKLSFELWKKYG